MEEHTQDLRPAPVPVVVRRAGRRSYIAGLALGASAYFICLCTAIAADEGNAFESQPAQVFGTLGLVALIGVSIALIISGSNARQFQRQLEPILTGLAERQRENEGNRILLERLTDELRTRDEVIMGHIEVIPHRIAQLEDDNAEIKVTLRDFTSVLALLAEKLPDELIARHWKGYNSAIRDGFAAKTGTEGDARRPPYIGLVRPGEDTRQ